MGKFIATTIIDAWGVRELLKPVYLVIEMRGSVFLSLVIELGILTPLDSSVLSGGVKGQFELLLDPEFKKLATPKFCGNLIFILQPMQICH